MLLKDIKDEDFTNYKKASMFLIFPYCSFKCDVENKTQLCQNMPLIKQPNVEIEIDDIIKRYLDNPITHAIVCGGLEPMDSFKDLNRLCKFLRWKYECHDDIVIYTGYNKDEIEDKIAALKKFDNIIIKFGRFRPNESSHKDEILGVELVSNNQYAEKIS